MKNCIYEPVFGLFLLFNFQIDSALTFSSRLNYSCFASSEVNEVKGVIAPYGR